MRVAIAIFLSGLSLAGSTCFAEAKGDTVLFAHAAYRFVVVSWRADPISPEKKRVSLVISYEIPKGARFILYASRSMTEPWVDSFFSEELKSPPKGKVTVEFESIGDPPAFYFGLWRGVVGASPSGVLCDGAMVSLPLKITPVFRHEKSPNQVPEPTAASGSGSS